MNKSTTVFSLLELTRIVEGGFKELFDEFLFWCEAEIGSIKQYGPRRYIDLYEYGKNGKVAAKVTGIVWQDSVLQAFLKQTGNTVSSLQGKQVMIQGYLSFHTKYGLSISILGFSKEFEQGKQIDHRKAVVEQLTKKGLFTKNREQVLEKKPLSIAVISSPQSEGLRDFLSIIDESLWNYDYQLFASKVNGDVAVPGIVSAFSMIDKAIEEGAKYDIVFLLRGGGGQEGFAWQNHYDVCESVTLCKVPVCVAIGHTADTSLLDELCWLPKKTPSDAAWWIVEFYTGISNTIDEYNDSIVRTIKQRLLSYAKDISYFYDAILHQSKSSLLWINETVTNLWTTIQGFSPDKILSKGYALLEDETGILSKESISNLQSGSRISIQTKTHKIHVTIDKIEEKK